MQYINNNSDFALDIALKAILPDGAELATAPPNCDFTLTFGTRYDEAKYEVGRYNGEPRGYTVNTDGSLHVIFDAHGLGLGRLGCMLTYGIPDSSYPDGVATVATSYELDVELIGWGADGQQSGTVTIATEAAAVGAAQQAQAAAERAAQAAEASQQAAQNAENAAQASAAESQASANAAKASESAAQAAAESSEASRQAAEQAAEQAQQARAEAGTAAESAAQASNAAQASKAAAQAAATASAESATAAQNSVESAAAAVTAAQQAIDTANTAADTANTAAQAANTAADNANTAADSASEYVERYDAIAGALPKVTDTFEGVAQDTGLRYVIRKNKLIAILKDGRVQYAPEGLAYVDAIEPTSFVYGTKTYEVPAGESYVELGQSAPTSVGAILRNNVGIRAFGLYSDTSKNTSLRFVFSNAADLEWLDVSAMDASAVTLADSMFSGSAKLREIMGKLDLSKAKTIDWCFGGCTALERVDIQPITAACTAVANAFNGCASLTALDFSAWDLSKVTTMQGFCRDCKSLKTLVLPTASNPVLTNISYFLSGSGLDSVDLNDFDVSAVTEMAQVLSACPNLREVIIPNWHAPNLTNTSGLFAFSPLLERIDISGLTMDNVTNVTHMFLRCYALTSLKFPHMGQLKADSDNNKTIGFSDDPLDRASLDSIFSYDRTANGLTNPLTVALSNTSKALLSAEDIAAITAKGYTIV